MDGRIVGSRPGRVIEDHPAKVGAPEIQADQHDEEHHGQYERELHDALAARVGPRAR